MNLDQCILISIWSISFNLYLINFFWSTWKQFFSSLLIGVLRKYFPHIYIKRWVIFIEQNLPCLCPKLAEYLLIKTWLAKFNCNWSLTFPPNLKTIYQSEFDHLEIVSDISNIWIYMNENWMGKLGLDCMFE